VYSHKVWIDTELSKMIGGPVPYPMLSDDTGNIAQLYGVYDSQYGIAQRATFIINPEGYINGSEILINPVGRSTSEILRQLKSFQNYHSTGQLIPADWQPGDKTITESVESAGNIWRKWKPAKH
jgi:alkyl hydroperoxide reductase subunit AhpC